MVDWHDPVLLLRDYFDLTKLLHATAGLYIWETVFTAGFELNVLRGKQPYRWTIWIYLGTRYTNLIMFIIFFIHNDAGHVPCKLFMILNYGLSIASWAFASLIIVLRIIAIWERNTIVSSISLVTWLAGLGLNIRTLTMIEGTYDPVFDACLALKTHSGLVGAAAVLGADTILFMIMLIGLLRRAHEGSIGIWHLLYKQCIIWMILAAVVEVPPLVFLILDLNDAWNSMFSPVAVTILSICAARMYRSLSKQGSLTEFTSDPPQYPAAGLPYYRRTTREAQSVHSALHFSTAMTVEPFVFTPAEQTQVEFVHHAGAAAASDSTIAVPANAKSKVNTPAGYRMSWHRPGLSLIDTGGVR